MRSTVALILVLTFLLAACGSDEAATSSEATPTPTPTETPSPSAEEQYPADDEYTALALARNAASAARYCVRKIGAEVGAEQPPSAALLKAKRQLITNAKITARDNPDVEINGKPFADFLMESADILRTGECDTRGAATLEDLAFTLP